jgi:REP element-mobilizing transposase RayT
MRELSARKSPRLKGYDYSQAGCYFVTVCVEDGHELLSEIVGGGFHAASIMKLSDIGDEVAKSIDYINKHYIGVDITKYVIMPNHIHLIIFLSGGHGNPMGGHGNTTGGHGNPPLQAVVGQLKSYTTKKWNDICDTKMQEIWQRSFHDHIIRDEKDYQNHWQYIENNPSKWQEDEYFVGIR